MAIPFHLHNCGNFLDKSSAFFRKEHFSDSAMCRKHLSINNLNGSAIDLLWPSICSRRTSSAVLIGGQCQANFSRVKNR